MLSPTAIHALLRTARPPLPWRISYHDAKQVFSHTMSLEINHLHELKEMDSHCIYRVSADLDIKIQLQNSMQLC